MELGTWKFGSKVFLMDMLCSMYIMPWDKQWAYRKSNYLNRVSQLVIYCNCVKFASDVIGLTTFRDELVLPATTRLQYYEVVIVFSSNCRIQKSHFPLFFSFFIWEPNFSPLLNIPIL